MEKGGTSIIFIFLIDFADEKAFFEKITFSTQIE
jgi:hypothetical protein